MTEKLSKFMDAVQYFACPICASDFTLQGANSFVCENRHTFDLASRGYVNFTNNQKPTKYGKDLFLNKRKIFSIGLFDATYRTILDACLHYKRNLPSVRLLDAGCGEGYYASRIENETSLDVYGLDIEKEAIRLSASRPGRVKWLVADIARIPLKNNSMDIICNVFSPANYAEFSRILNETGILIKAYPGKTHLQELRAYLPFPNNKEESDIAAHCAKSFHILEQKNVCCTHPIQKEHVLPLLYMTPLLFHVDIANLELDDLNEITIDAEIIIANKIV